MELLETLVGSGVNVLKGLWFKLTCLSKVIVSSAVVIYSITLITACHANTISTEDNITRFKNSLYDRAHATLAHAKRGKRNFTFLPLRCLMFLVKLGKRG